MSLTDFSLLVYKNARDFYFLIVYPTTLPNSLMNCGSFLVACLGFLCIVSCHLQKVTVWVLLFQFVFLLFLFLQWLPWLGFPKLCWMKVVRVDILVLFLILEEMLLIFHHWEWSVLWVCQYGLYGIEVGSPVPISWRVFMINGHWILTDAFWICWDDRVDFILQFVSLVYYMDFAYIEESLLWDKSHFIMAYNPFNVLLDSVW